MTLLLYILSALFLTSPPEPNLLAFRIGLSYTGCDGDITYAKWQEGVTVPIWYRPWGGNEWVKIDAPVDSTGVVKAWIPGTMAQWTPHRGCPKVWEFKDHRGKDVTK